MLDAFLSIVPYSLGLIISPIPIIVIILLLVGKSSLRKSTWFAISWVATTFLATFLISILIQSLQKTTGDASWKSTAALVVGIILIIVAAYIGRTAIRIRRRGRPRTPEWLKAIDDAPALRVALFGMILVVFNPVNLSMIFAAAIGLSATDLANDQMAIVAALFAILGSISVLIPYLVDLIAGARAENFLHTLRKFLIRNNGRLSFWSTLAFGVFFVVKGLG